MPSALEAAGFLPYFGAAGGPRIYTTPGRAQLQAEQSMLSSLQSAFDRLVEDERMRQAAQDPAVQSMLDYISTGGTQPLAPAAPVSPGRTAADIAEMTGVLGPAAGLASPPPSVGPLAPRSSLGAPFPAATGPVSPGVSVDVGTPVIQSRNGRAVGGAPTEFLDTARQAMERNASPSYGVNLPRPAGGATRQRPPITPEALRLIQGILPHYAQIRIASEAATGRQETERIRGGFAKERKQIDAAVSILSILQKREGALLEHDAKMVKIVGRGKVAKGDIKAIQAALNAAQKDATDTRRLLSEQNVAGLSESDPGSNARKYYDQIAELAQQKEQRVQMYQRILDQATMEQRPSTVRSAVGTPLPTTLTAEDQQAVEWARRNPRDPRAARILQSLGLAR